jgi:hypothetical protein
MRKKFRFPSAAMVVALIALFVALSGTAVAAGIVPLARRALVADNAKKLNGQTRGQILASFPRPSVTIRSNVWSLDANGDDFWGARCLPGEKALAGGYVNLTGAPKPLVVVGEEFPSETPPGWNIHLVNFSNRGASGTIYVVCMS